MLTVEQWNERVIAMESGRIMDRGTLTKVEPYERDGETYYSFTVGGWGISGKAIDGAPEPKVGDDIVVYGQIGYRAWGIDINGQPLFFMTLAEREAEREAEIARMDREREERFEQERDRLDDDYEALPASLKARIDRFRAGNPNFRKDFEGYEMAGLNGAVELAEACTDPAFGEMLQSLGFKVPSDKVQGKSSYEWTPEDGVEWENTPYNRWRAAMASNTKINGYQYQWEAERLPKLAAADSGNLHGYAMIIARFLLAAQGYDPSIPSEDGIRLLEQYHGAMVPLVGCEAYGCTHTPVEEPAEA